MALMTKTSDETIEHSHTPSSVTVGLSRGTDKSSDVPILDMLRIRRTLSRCVAKTIGILSIDSRLNVLVVGGSCLRREPNNMGFRY